MALEAVSLGAGFPEVTFCAVVHFMRSAVLCFAEPEHALTPDIPAVAGDPVFLIFAKGGGVSYISVACLALHFSTLYMGGMGEKYIVRLLCIYMPGHFLVLFNIFLYEFFFGRTGGHGVHVTVFAFIQTGGAGEAAVIPEEVAGIAGTQLFYMHPVVELNRLLLGGVKQFWKGKPAGEYADNESDQEKNKYDPAGGPPVGSGRLVVMCAHGYSVKTFCGSTFVLDPQNCFSNQCPNPPRHNFQKNFNTGFGKNCQ